MDRQTFEENLDHPANPLLQMLLNGEILAGLGSWEFHRNNETCIWSNGMFQLFELSKEGFSPHLHSIEKFCVPEDAVVLRDAISKSLSVNQGFDVEVRALSAKKKKFWMRVRGIVLRFGDPDSILVGSCQNIGEFRSQIEDAEVRRKEAERRETFYREVIDRLPIAVFCKDAKDDLKYTIWNQCTASLVGVSAEETLGKKDFDVFPIHGGLFRQTDREVLETGQLLEIPEEPIETRSQGVRWIHTYKIPMLDSEGRPEYLLGITKDITENRRIQAQLRIFQQVAEEMNLGLYVYHLEDRSNPESLKMLIANRASGVCTGLDPQSVIGKRVSEIFPNAPTTLPFYEVARDCSSIDMGRVSYLAPQSTEEEHYLVKAFGMPGDLVGVLFENITARVKAEDALEEKKLAILNSSRLTALGEMAANLAHEINNPLAILKARAQQFRSVVLQDLPTPEQLLKYIQVVDITVDRIAGIIRGLRTFTRESSQDPFIETDARALVEETLSFCRGRFSYQGIGFKLDVPEGLRFDCRPGQISQILLNLLNNSVDAVSGLSEKWVSLRVWANSERIYFEVQDSGPGIPKEIQPRIMEAFFTTKEAGKGTGLGLSISQGLAQAHRGILTLDGSSQNTSFILSIPIKQDKLLFDA